MLRARGYKDQVAIRQVRRFVVGSPQTKGQLSWDLAGKGPFIDVVVIEPVGTLPRKGQALAVKGHIHIAQHAARVVKQTRHTTHAGALVEVEPAQARAGPEETLGTRVAQALGVADEAHVHRVAFGPRQGRPLFDQATQARCTPCEVDALVLHECGLVERMRRCHKLRRGRAKRLQSPVRLHRILAQQVSPGSGLDVGALVLGAGRHALARSDDGLRPSRLGRGTGAGRKADHHKKEAPHHLMFGFGPMATKSTARS